MRPFVLVIGGTPEEQLSIVENLEDAGYTADSTETLEGAADFGIRTQGVVIISSLRSVENFGLAAFRRLQESLSDPHLILTVPRERVSHLDLPGLNIGQVVPAPFLLRDLLKAVRRSSSSWFSWKRSIVKKFGAAEQGSG